MTTTSLDRLAALIASVAVTFTILVQVVEISRPIDAAQAVVTTPIRSAGLPA
jgi:hypothetical protein